MISLRTCLALTLALAGCGGKVVFDTSQGGAGGTGSGPSATSGTSSSAKSTSVGTTVASSSSTGGLIDCSNFDFKGIGSPCPMLEGQTCVVPSSCCATQATCVQGQWTVSGGPACGQPCIDCGGGLACDTQSICVNGQPDIGGSWFACFPDPCAGKLDCSCAKPACASMFLQCGGPSSPTTIVCDCPNC